MTSATLACSAARISGSEISPKTCTMEESAAWARARVRVRVRVKARVRARVRVRVRARVRVRVS